MELAVAFPALPNTGLWANGLTRDNKLAYQNIACDTIYMNAVRLSCLFAIIGPVGVAV